MFLVVKKGSALEKNVTDFERVSLKWVENFEYSCEQVCEFWPYLHYECKLMCA